jgi:hypothetical protein
MIGEHRAIRLRCVSHEVSQNGRDRMSSMREFAEIG